MTNVNKNWIYSSVSGFTMFLLLSCFMQLFVWTTLAFAKDDEFPWILFYPAINRITHVKVPSWSAIETITNTGPIASYDSLMDYKGNVTVIWKFISSTKEYVSFLSKRFEVGSGWSSIENIETLTTGTSDSIYHSGPKLILDSFGNINMVWATKRIPGHETPDKFWARRFTNDNGWEQKVLLHSITTSTNNYPTCLEDLSKNISVCTSQFFSKGFSDEGYVFYKTGGYWRIGGSFASRIESSYMEFPAPLPAFINNFGFVDEFGNFILYNADTRNNILYVNNYSTHSDTINKQVIHNQISNRISDIRIVKNKVGNAAIVWRDFDGSKYNLWANNYTIGFGWGTAQIITDNNQSDDVIDNAYIKSIHVAGDHMGNFTAIWRQKSNDDPTIYNLYTNRYLVGKGWGKAELIENMSRSAGYPLMSVDNQGNVTVVWRQHNGQYYRLWSKRHNADSGWGAVQEVPVDPPSRIPKELIIDNFDNAALVHIIENFGSLSSNRYTLNSGWSISEGYIGYFPNDTYIQNIIVDDANNITLFMIDASFTPSPIGKQLTSARYNEERGWHLNKLISYDAVKNPRPHVMIDSEGSITVVFGEMPFTDKISTIRAIQLLNR